MYSIPTKLPSNLKHNEKANATWDPSYKIKSHINDMKDKEGLRTNLT